MQSRIGKIFLVASLALLFTAGCGDVEEPTPTGDSQAQTQQAPMTYADAMREVAASEAFDKQFSGVSVDIESTIIDGYEMVLLEATTPTGEVTHHVFAADPDAKKLVAAMHDTDPAAGIQAPSWKIEGLGGGQTAGFSIGDKREMASLLAYLVDESKDSGSDAATLLEYGFQAQGSCGTGSIEVDGGAIESCCSDHDDCYDENGCTGDAREACDKTFGKCVTMKTWNISFGAMAYLTVAAGEIWGAGC